MSGGTSFPAAEQTALSLCRGCLSWQGFGFLPHEAEAYACPSCGAMQAAGDADPSADELAARIGEPRACWGPVRLRRRWLPEAGEVVATEAGLLFLPGEVGEAWRGWNSREPAGRLLGDPGAFFVDGRAIEAVRLRRWRLLRRRAVVERRDAEPLAFEIPRGREAAVRAAIADGGRTR